VCSSDLAYVLAPPPGVAVSTLSELVMSTGPDASESISALYTSEAPAAVVVGMWSLVDATLQTSWSRAGADSFGGMSADGAYVAVALTDGAVLLKRGSNEEVFSFTSDLIVDVSVNVVRAPGGASDTVFLAAAGGNNDAGGTGTTGDAFAYEVDVPDTVTSALLPLVVAEGATVRDAEPEADAYCDSSEFRTQLESAERLDHPDHHGATRVQPLHSEQLSDGSHYNAASHADRCFSEGHRRLSSTCYSTDDYRQRHVRAV
jgi:hypothetical protein